MKKLMIAATMAAALAVPSLASAAPVSNTTCNNATADYDWAETNVLPAKIVGNLTVPDGGLCRLHGNEITGNISVGKGATLHVFGMTADNNVSVDGGSFVASNWGVTIGGNLSILNPAPYTQSGFWGNYSSNEVKGNVSFTLDGTVTFPDSGWPSLYAGGGVTVDKNLTYSVGGLSSVRPFDASGWNVIGHITTS